MHHEIPVISRIREARESGCWILERRVPGTLFNQSLTAFPFGTHVAQQGELRVASDIDGQEKAMNMPRKGTLRICASRPTTFVSFHRRNANVLLYRLYTTRCIACSRSRARRSIHQPSRPVRKTERLSKLRARPVRPRSQSSDSRNDQSRKGQRSPRRRPAQGPQPNSSAGLQPGWDTKLLSSYSPLALSLYIRSLVCPSITKL